jgi:hypothetical protein
MFSGLRRGQSPLSGLGAALLAIGWVRTLYRGDRELIWSRTLKPGDSIRIRLVGSDDEVEIDG